MEGEKRSQVGAGGETGPDQANVAPIGSSGGPHSPALYDAVGGIHSFRLKGSWWFLSFGGGRKGGERME